MAYEIRDMSGSAFINDKKTGDSSPDFRGAVMIGGIEYWHSIWKKKTKTGQTWLSSSLQVKEPKRASEPVWGGDLPRATSTPSGEADFDDDLDVPF